ncbi:phosphoesterase [Stieleria sp. JC731]|uniref:phosphoesterase n=1 Tax=Pirellulaceae TaxID=2691357 RepID=UPI001E596A6A|nr:phosphoesterase [Stieleria sp. JC731]MCC9602587.1 phosphoesterase [Stieleria sp. JC731]
MPTTEEHVLVIPASVIESIGAFEGFESDIDRYLGPILNSDQLSYQPRGAMEVDPSFKQLIPYVVLEWQNENGEPQVFTYTRGGGGGEKRLHAKRSIGIGGHISQEDSAGNEDAYQVGMRRELEEEIQLDAEYSDTQEGLIYDPSNEVGQVHLGVVHRFRLSAPNVSSREDDLAEGGFVSVAELRQQRENLETWSQLALDALFPNS